MDVDTQKELTELRHELAVLARQVKSVRVVQQVHGEFIDTVTSAAWKRALWWLEGYYVRKVGRWYGPNRISQALLRIPGWPK